MDRRFPVHFHYNEQGGGKVKSNYLYIEETIKLKTNIMDCFNIDNINRYYIQHLKK